MKCTSENVTTNYIPPPLGNGELSIMLDMEGMQRQKTYPGNMTPMIWWAGRRYDTHLGELIPFGYLGQGTETPQTWTQNLNVHDACMETECEYAAGMHIRTEAFVHLEKPLLAVRKTVQGEYTLTYTLAQPGPSGLPPARMQFMSAATPRGVDISYEIPGMEPYHGIISLCCDRDVKVQIAGNRFSLTVGEGTASFFLLFVDSMDYADVHSAAADLKRLVESEGYDGLFASHREAWQGYWAEAYVKLSSQRHSDVYDTAQYHLRISSTRWSMPVGLFQKHWFGKYFGFDEHFGFMGLASSGHLDVARKVPEFRHRVLEKAIVRAFNYFRSDNANTGARFHWETNEKGEECAPAGFWLEHIFHMANIALTSWNYYRFSGDREFLAETGYPVIARCAEFYQDQSVYELGEGRFIVGKCTDLERLGPAHENAFMTTCGVIATFNAAAAAAEILSVDTAKAERWRMLAGKLRETLPEEGGRYIPHPGCDQKSIAVFAGTFPYPALPPDDARQLQAMEEFLAEEGTYGNMYPVGNSVCVWYAGWIGIVFARLGQFDKVQRCIEQAVDETNCFAEIFEISNPPNHPWFTTAEGTFIQMVNESLLQSTDDEIRIIPHAGDDYAFKLPAMGGVMVEGTFVNGAPETLILRATQVYTGGVILPDGSRVEVELAPAGEVSLLDLPRQGRTRARDQ